MLPKATTLMRLAVIFLGIIVSIFAVCLFPEISRESEIIARLASQRISSRLVVVNYSFLIGLYSAVIPFFIALRQTLKLLSFIDKKKAFSDFSVKALKKIKYCACAICALYMLGVMPLMACVADIDDAPGLVVIAFTIGLSPIIIATFAAILQKLLQEAIIMKSEIDLTI